MKTIKALVSFVYIGANGSITSYAGGQVYEVANDVASQMISIGYAEEYSEGGGGSSDFSTAEVTLINSGSAMGIGLYLCVVDDVNNSTDTTARLIVGTSKTFNAILYNGEAYASLYDSTSIDSYDGNIEPAGKNGYVITGDCTITIS